MVAGKILLNIITYGLVYYENQKIKNVCNELIKLMIVRR